jgi:hypothetical protein
VPGSLVTRVGELSAEAAMRWSRSALDRTLAAAADLSVLTLTTEATVLGDFQRSSDVLGNLPLVRRISGGPAIAVGPGTLHVLLALSRPSAMMACTERQLVNRHVRPLLRALTKSGALAHYFGRDWISALHRPVGEALFAHDTRSGRAVFEAFVAVTRPFAVGARGSFMGKEPATLEEVAGKTFDIAALAAAIADAYRAEAGGIGVAEGLEVPEGLGAHVTEEPPWSASAMEAIGPVAAGRDAEGALRLGGELLASRDAVERVGRRVDGLPLGAGLADIGAIVDGELAAVGVALEGVRDLNKVCEVLAKGRR